MPNPRIALPPQFDSSAAVTRKGPAPGGIASERRRHMVALKRSALDVKDDIKLRKV